jgi:hypothetical protein
MMFGYQRMLVFSELPLVGFESTLRFGLDVLGGGERGNVFFGELGGGCIFVGEIILKT